MYNDPSDTIAAVTTGSGGAIAVIRVSGPAALGICDKIFEPVSGKPLTGAKGYTLHYGTIKDGGKILDDVLVSVFRNPRSYTGEDMAEISCHGSPYIKNRIISLLTCYGARPAAAGEFTMRAFLAGKLDLSQAEAVADIIASQDRASHALAVNQMRGGYSEEFRLLREELLELLSLLELELDFSEEDVEFADRGRLVVLIGNIIRKVETLIESYSLNNTLKEGVPVAIAGEPNTGKSTLLNALIKEDRAMVSDIAGTTRDVIEESHVIDGVRFRFTDTAGLRETPDILESMGIERAKGAIAKSRILLYLVAPDEKGVYDIEDAAGKIGELTLSPDTSVYLLLNKSDKLSPDATRPDVAQYASRLEDILAGKGLKSGLAATLQVSAKTGEGIGQLMKMLVASFDTGAISAAETIVTNSRHYEALVRSREALRRASEGIENELPSDLLAQDIRHAVSHLGSIAGQDITSDQVLSSIFGRFCIGK